MQAKGCQAIHSICHPHDDRYHHFRVLGCPVMMLFTSYDGRSSRTAVATGAVPATRCPASAGSGARRHDRLSARARERLRTALLAGDPDGETTLAWTIAQDMMGLYQQHDPIAGRRRAEQLIADLRDCPIPELARLGRTLQAWRPEFLAHFDRPAVSNGPTGSLNLKIKNTMRKARGFRNFANCRPRLLLKHGRNHQACLTIRIRTRRPSFVAQSCHSFRISAFTPSSVRRVRCSRTRSRARSDNSDSAREPTLESDNCTSTEPPKVNRAREGAGRRIDDNGFTRSDCELSPGARNIKLLHRVTQSSFDGERL